MTIARTNLLLPLSPSSECCLFRIELPHHRPARALRRSTEWNADLQGSPLDHFSMPSRLALELTDSPPAVALIKQNCRRQDIGVASGEGANDLSQKAALAWICKRTTAFEHLSSGVSHLPVTNRLEACSDRCEGRQNSASAFTHCRIPSKIYPYWTS